MCDNRIRSKCLHWITDVPASSVQGDISDLTQQFRNNSTQNVFHFRLPRSYLISLTSNTFSNTFPFNGTHFRCLPYIIHASIIVETEVVPLLANKYRFENARKCPANLIQTSKNSIHLGVLIIRGSQHTPSAQVNLSTNVNARRYNPFPINYRQSEHQSNKIKWPST